MKSWLTKYVVRPARRVEINPYFALAAVKTETVLLAADLGIMILIWNLGWLSRPLPQL